MNLATFFALGVVILQALAGLTYGLQGQWKQAGVWLCISAANAFLASMGEK